MRFSPFALISALIVVPSLAGCQSDDQPTGSSATSGTGGSSTSSTSSTSSSGTGGKGGTGGTGGSTSSAGGGGATSSSAGGGGSGGTGGTGGNGAGGSGGCGVPADCPPTGNACVIATCASGQCGTDFVPAGQPALMQVTGDCKVDQCDGAGVAATVNDDNDKPDDGDACTLDLCNAGVASHADAPAGTMCGVGLVCNGNGGCVGCNAASECGQDTACKTFTCNAGMCGSTPQPQGTTNGVMQVSGDCKTAQCDGMGAIENVPDDLDAMADANECTADQCSGGMLMHPPLMAGTTCSVTKVCDGMGVCVECVDAMDCSSGSCVNDVCETCTDNAKNGTETGLDCGGGACPPCGAGQPCMVASDCGSGVCMGSVCQAAGVVSTTPADVAMGVSETSTIAITFTASMAPASLTAQTTAGACSGSIQVSTDDFATCIAFSAAAPTMSMSNTVATLTPAPGLAYGTTYKVRVTTAATDAGGGPLGMQYTSATGFTTGVQAPGCNGSVVISQIYGGGGNAGAPYLNDFIELHNRGAVAVNVSTWSVQYAAAAGSNWAKTNLTGTIPAGGYYLIKEQTGGAVGAALPTSEASGSISMSATAGKIALVSDQVTLAVSCPNGANIADFAGYGLTANCYEGTGPTPAPSNSQAILRGGAGCTDATQNPTDFTAGAPTPRNSMTQALVCSCGGDRTLNESGVTAEADLCSVVSQGTLSIAPGGTTPLIKGLVDELNVTEAAGANAGLVAQIGFGPATANPEWQGGWQWFSAAYSQQSGTADEYQATLTVPAAGTYFYAFRFSLNGVDWTYCDADGAGSSALASFEPPDLPLLVVGP